METKSILIDKIRLINRIAADYYGIIATDIYKKTRKREIVEKRQVVHYLSWKNTNANLELIGNIIGEKDHATVLHSKKTIIKLMDVDKGLKHDIDVLEQKIKYRFKKYKDLKVSKKYRDALLLRARRSASVRHKTPYILVNKLEY
jgi:chromosomal replication initiator protein